MHLPWRAALATLALAPSTAAADPIELGGWLGPRFFSTSRLGYIDDAPAHPELQNGIEFGGRLGLTLLPWLAPEFELAMSPTTTNAVGGAAAASVFWFEPRLQLRFELRPDQRVQPFVVVGGGTPVALSSATRTFATSIIGDGFVGGGVRFDTQKGFALRADAKLAILPAQPGAGFGATAELDVGIGISFVLGGPHHQTAEEARLARGEPPPDRDGDGIPDAQDACPDRPEDKDGFEDEDGCPDIDNDHDLVLDIADKCPNVPETYNGFEDDDGCPDTVPPDVDALRGTIEGLLYAEGETSVRDSALPGLKQIARTMTTHPSIRVVLIGHTDDREAKQFAAADDGHPDLEALSTDLAKARAEAVKNALGTNGIPEGRIIVEGRGAEEPVSDNTKPRGRLANRRVEIKLYVPQR
jgi:outer membrane protein OmpA-like peptidoglycan-associated protein